MCVHIHTQVLLRIVEWYGAPPKAGHYRRVRGRGHPPEMEEEEEEEEEEEDLQGWQDWQGKDPTKGVCVCVVCVCVEGPHKGRGHGGRDDAQY